MLTSRHLVLGLATVLLASNACSDDPVDTSLQWPQLECDPLVPEVCGFPYPNNVFTRVDTTSSTGRRLALSTSAIPSGATSTSAPAPFNLSDGFSPGTALYAYLPNASAKGLNSAADIDASLESSSRTIVLNTTTGQLVPHYAGLDRSTDNAAQRSIMIQPAVRLDDNTRYIVALQNIRDDSNEVLPATAVFKQILTGTSQPDPSVPPRRFVYKDMFERLRTVGVNPDDLQLAWDFTTASRDNNVSAMVHMRDEGLARVDAAAPGYTIDSVETEGLSDSIAYRLKGYIDAPLYLDNFDPGATLLRDASGLPVLNESTPTHPLAFEVIIPKSALAEPAALLQYGHGLLGRRTQIESEHFATFMNEYNYIMFAVDLAGMASEDEVWIGNTLVSGELNQLSHMFDRMHQGVLDNLVAMRVMMTHFAADATYGGFIDPTRRYYHGISQGGIFGGVYMGLTTDVERGALGVMGQSYNLLLNRSVDFDVFFALMRNTYTDARDQQLALAMLQLMWDRVEPTGYAADITRDPLPGTPPNKQILMRAAVGDHQVSTLAAHVMARSMNAVHVDTGVRSIWGFVPQANNVSGASYVEYDFGLPDEPLCNVPMRLCEDPHGKVRRLPAARQQLDHFLRSGEVKSFCTGACSFPEMSGCTADNNNAPDPCVDAP